MVPPLDGGEDHLPYAVEVLEHVRVDDPEHLEAVGFENARSFRVSIEFHTRTMRRPVDLHDQLCAKADEIDDVAFDQILAPNLPTVEAIAPQRGPQFHFRARLLLPQLG